MRVDQGGTRIYCPHCKKVTICAGKNPSYITGKSGQRWYRSDYSDIQWFRRARQCQTCFDMFLTAELSEDFLKELIELRGALANIKKNAEAYIHQSSSAAESLKQLAESLGVLRALKIYAKA